MTLDFSRFKMYNVVYSNPACKKVEIQTVEVT